MSEPIVKLTPGDLRRAAALVVHYGQDSPQGVAAILEETAEENRAAALVLAIVSMYDEIVPAIHTDTGLQILSRHVMQLAGFEEEGP